jgi:hypothetical protein
MARFQYKDYLTSSNAGDYQKFLNEDVHNGVQIKLGDNGTGHKTKSGKGPEFAIFDIESWDVQTKGTPEQTIALFKKDEIKDNKGVRHKFTHIFKTPYSSRGKDLVNPKISEQESLSLLIIENILSRKTQNYNNFTAMMNDPNSGVKKAYPNIDKCPTSWIVHFSAQFDQIGGKLKGLNTSGYDVFQYTNGKGFMSFITKLITKDNKWYSKKDSWNPADIWLIKNSKLATYKKLLTNAVSIENVNHILRDAANKGDILGISLKKSNGTNIKIEKVNLKLDKGELEKVKLTYVKMNSTFAPRKKKPFYLEEDKKALPVFLSKTSTIRFSQGDKIYDLFFRSNQSTLKNITWEIKNIKGKSFLGKVPVDKMAEWLAEHNTKLPHAPKLHKTFSETYWKNILKGIENSKFELIDDAFNTTQILENIKTSYKDDGIGMHNGNYLQMIQFVYSLTLLKDDQLTTFLTNCFYFAQKKGTANNFGPFVKLY